MVRDAEKFAEEDKKRRETAEVRNQADSLVHTTQKQLDENGDKIDAGLKSEIEGAIAEAKTALEGDDSDAIRTKSEALAQVAMKMGQAIYEQQSSAQSEAPTGGAAAGSEGGAEEDVVDAEFSEVDDEKKG
jgi:molecular chaperone DnaK